MKWLWRLGGLLVAFGLIVYFLWFTWQNLDLHAFAAALKKPWTIVALLLAIACHNEVYPLNGVAWRRLLLSQGEHWRSGESRMRVGWGKSESVVVVSGVSGN